MSTTLDAGNYFILRLAARAQDFHPTRINESSFEKKEVRVYEYEILNAEGFVTPDDYGMASEKEIVTRFIPLLKVARYRIHEILPKENNHIEILNTSEWTDFN